MLEVAKYAAFLLLAYLIGSLPFGFWLAKVTKGPKFDIRDHGSCSIGFTNVLRVVGWRTALPVLIADMLKGYVPAMLGNIAVGPVFGAVCLLFAGLGHAKSVYFFWKDGVFSGGKSAATMIGGIFAIQPGIAATCAVAFLLILAVSKIVSISTMSAALIAFVYSLLAGLGPAWNWVFGLTFVLILYTHRRNVARLVAGIEPKIGHTSESDEVISAFVLHPLDRSDFDQSPLISWINRLVKSGVINERQFRALIAKCPLLETGQITGIKAKDGKHGRVLILAVPLLPDQIKDPAYQPILDRLLKAAAVQAQRQGAKVLTLGALLSSYSGGGTPLQSWCKERGFTIEIDNGAAFTVTATLEAIRSRLEERKIKLDQASIAIVGAKGLIGRRISEELEGKAKKVISLAREKNAVGEKMEIDLTQLWDADVIVFATSAPEAIITRENVYLINPRAMIVDVAVPPDVALDVPRQIIRSGLIVLPGNPKIDMDFHFGERNGVKLVPACLAQGWILAATKRYEHASRGARLRPENVVFFDQAYRELGLKIETSHLSEPAVFRKTE